MKETFELWDTKNKQVIRVEAIKKEGKESLALCPNPEHDDHHESLRINKEKKVYRCPVCEFSGHLYDPDYKTKGIKQKPITYDYQDEKGKLLFQVCRYPGKKFSQRQPDGKGDWINSIKGVRRVLYRLPELIKGEDPVFIVEGEKDTGNVWKLGLTATTCPMGAKKWKKEYDKALEGREVILVPHNDKEGREHSEQAGTSLFGEAKNIKWLELPGLKEKEDISDWIERGGTREDLLKLAKQAPEYNPNRKVYQLAGSYIKRGKEVIANFVIVPKARVQTDEGETLKADIIPQQGKPYTDVQFHPDSWISKRNFKQALKGKLNLEYRGSEDDIEDIKGILASQNPPVKQGVKTVGLHKIEGRWVYIEENIAWDREGPREDIIYISDYPYKVRLLKQPDLSSEQLDEILNYLFSFNAEDITYPILGFCFSCFVKERLIKTTSNMKNTTLVCWGEKESGKSRTLENIIQPLFAIQSPLGNIGNPTKFAFARLISSSNLAPAIFDEHKPSKLLESQRILISEAIRTAYEQDDMPRGRPDQSLIHYIFSAPIIIAGEMGFSELALRDRTVEVYFSKKKLEGKKEAFEKLLQLPLGSLGKDFLLYTLNLPDTEIKEFWKQQVENVDNQLKNRLKENTAHARLGLALFLNYLIAKNKDPKRFEEGFNIIDQAQKENILEASNKTIVDQTIEAFSVMAGQGNILEEGKHYKFDVNGNLNLHISSIYPLFKKWAKDYQWEGEVLDKSSFVKQLKEAKYFIKYDSVRFLDKIKKAYLLDLSQMKHLEIENFTETTTRED